MLFLKGKAYGELAKKKGGQAVITKKESEYLIWDYEDKEVQNLEVGMKIESNRINYTLTEVSTATISSLSKTTITFDKDLPDKNQPFIAIQRFMDVSDFLKEYFGEGAIIYKK